jgi:hypothetical protein
MLLPLLVLQLWGPARALLLRWAAASSRELLRPRIQHNLDDTLSALQQQQQQRQHTCPAA